MGTDNFTCGTCQKGFPSGWRARDAHCAAVHHAPPEFECDICPRYFASSRASFQHMARKNHFAYLCEACGLTWPTGPELHEHEEVEHGHWPCEECGHAFGSLLAVNMHTSKMHRYECEWCDCLPASPTVRRRHEVKVHKAHYCRQCQSLCYSAQDLESHRAEHEMDWSCTVCSLPLPSRQWLVDHERADHLLCRECRLVFRTKEGIEAHLRSTHFAIECPFCQTEFEKGAQVVRHLETRSCPNAPQVSIQDISDAITDREPMGYLVSLLWGVQTVVCRKNWLPMPMPKHKLHYRTWRCPVCTIIGRTGPERDFHSYEDLIRHVYSDARESFGTGLKERAELMADPKNVFTCRNRRCEREFGTLTEAVEHLEGEECGYAKFIPTRDAEGNTVATHRVLL